MYIRIYIYIYIYTYAMQWAAPMPRPHVLGPSIGGSELPGLLLGRFAFSNLGDRVSAHWHGHAEEWGPIFANRQALTQSRWKARGPATLANDKCAGIGLRQGLVWHLFLPACLVPGLVKTKLTTDMSYNTELNKLKPYCNNTCDRNIWWRGAQKLNKDYTWHDTSDPIWTGHC